jgi:hypothetical protein
MERDEIRLECLRLAVSKTPDHQEGLLRAEAFFDFIVKPPQSNIAVDGAKDSDSTQHIGTTKPL